MKIIPLDKAIDALGLKLEAFVEAMKHNSIFLIILPKHSFNVGIKHKSRAIDLSSESYKDNPLNISVSNKDGFIPHRENNEKILHSLNWKFSEPYKIVNTDGKNEFASFETPKELESINAFKKSILEAKEAKLSRISKKIASDSLSYLDQVFFFQEKNTYKTELSLKEIFITLNDLETLKKHLSNSHKIDFKDVGDYEINKWSNSLITDMNAAYYHFIEKSKEQNISENNLTEEQVRFLFKERWNNIKQLSDESFKYAPKIILKKQNPRLNLNLLEVNYDDRGKQSKELYIESKKLPLEYKKRNQKNATDIMILIDIAAERHKKRIKGYENQGRFIETLDYLDITTKTIQVAIFSIIKAKK
jgi:hypothetical protein